MSEITGPVAVGPAEGETVPNPVGGPLTIKVRGEQTNGEMTAIETTVAPGEGPPLHAHANEEESLYVLDGEFRFKLEAEVITAPPGSFVFVPRGTAHTFQNVGAEPARLLVHFTPLRDGDLLRSLRRPVGSRFRRIPDPR
jgi:quercetin dioxygenase-like cupin family protein